MNYFKTLLVITALGSITGCSKNNSTPVQPLDVEKNLQSASWQMTIFTIAPALNGVTDVLLNMPSCSKDNLLQFKANGVFYLDEGASKCNASDAQTDQGVWNYDSAIKQLTYSSPRLGAFVIDVKDATAGTISGTRSIIINGANYTFSGTLTKQ